MRVFFAMSCLVLLGGCASHRGVSIARTAAPVSAAPPDTSVEVRHLYVFSPGKRPLLIVDRQEASVDRQEASAAPQELSAEPPTH